MKPQIMPILSACTPDISSEPEAWFLRIDNTVDVGSKAAKSFIRAIKPLNNIIVPNRYCDIKSEPLMKFIKQTARKASDRQKGNAWSDLMVTVYDGDSAYNRTSIYIDIDQRNGDRLCNVCCLVLAPITAKLDLCVND